MARQEPITATDFTFRAVFEPAVEGGYVVTFAAIPDLATQGETIDEAREMAEDCLRCYLEGLKKDGIPLPGSVQASTSRSARGVLPYIWR